MDEHVEGTGANVTGLGYDEVFLAHGIPEHPERPERLRVILRRLEETGLLREMLRLPVRAASAEEIGRLHDPSYVQEVRMLSETGGGDIDLDTRATAETWDAARAAVGVCIDAARAVYERDIDNAICLVRPPGHHARVDTGMGFCFFNNVALATEALIEDGRERIAIIDFDGHHGNGTQEMFYHRGDVLYVSLHQAPLFPGTGTVDEVGVDEGAGLTVNLPFPPHAQDTHYLRAFDELILPLLGAYEPEMILVSAGFDAHFRDTLVQLSLTARGFFLMTVGLLTAARELCEGRLMMALEGGYDLQIGLPESVEATVRALMRRPEVDWHPLEPQPHPEQTATVDEVVDAIIATHQERLG
ncbi:MAG: histone deacetylase [Armatimonadota bacterium]|jgi:acetoin utilization deacetylase AcuC-like enzyme